MDVLVKFNRRKIFHTAYRKIKKNKGLLKLKKEKIKHDIPKNSRSWRSREIFTNQVKNLEMKIKT